MGKVSIILLLLSLATYGCSKEGDDQFTTETAEATITWTGDYMVDGCGYSLLVNNEQYKITNEATVPDSYKKADFEKTDVVVKILNYHRQEIKPCMMPVKLNAVKILEIRKK